jgi:hypothetical protein
MSDISGSKLCVLLETFSSKEMSKFVDFVGSPFYNKNQVFCSLIKALDKAHPNFSKIKKVKLEQATKTKNLNNDMSALFKLAEQFLIVVHADNRPYLKQHIKLSELNLRLSGKSMQKPFKEAKSQIHASKIKSNEELLFDFLTDLEIDKAYSKDTSLPYIDVLQKKSESLDALYVYNKLQIYIEMSVRERLLSVSYKKTFFKEIREFVENRSEEFSQYPSIHIYLKLIDLLSKEFTRDEFADFFNSIKGNIDVSPRSETTNFIQHAINHCIKKVNNGEDYILELFNIMKFQVENNFLVVNSFVHDRSYKNIIEVAIRAKEYIWAKDFLDSHIKFVPGEDQTMIYNYNQANIFFAKGDYKAAQRNLTFINFKDVFYQLAYRTLQIKIQLETKDTLSVESSVKNFKSYLKREESLAEIQRNSYNFFLKYILNFTRILDKKNHFSKEELETKLMEVKESLTSEKHLADKKWLLKQTHVLFT